MIRRRVSVALASLAVAAYFVGARLAEAFFAIADDFLEIWDEARSNW